MDLPGRGAVEGRAAGGGADMNQYVSMNDLTAQIWRDAAQWKGWLLAAEQAGPPAFPALLSLPPSVLASALASMRQGAALRPKVDDSATAAVPGCFAGVPRVSNSHWSDGAGMFRGCLWYNSKTCLGSSRRPWISLHFPLMQLCTPLHPTLEAVVPAGRLIGNANTTCLSILLSCHMHNFASMM